MEYICSFLHLTEQRCTCFVHLISICSVLEHFLLLFSNSLTNLVRVHSHLWAAYTQSSAAGPCLTLKNCLKKLSLTFRSLLPQPLYIWREVGGTTWCCHLKLQITGKKKPNHLILTAADRYTAYLFQHGTLGWTAIYERKQQLMKLQTYCITKYILFRKTIMQCFYFYCMMPNYIT